MANMSMLKAVVNAEARVRVAQFQALPSQGLLFSACLSGASCLHCPPARGHKHGGLSGRPASSLSNRQQQAGISGQSQSRAAAESTHGHHGTVSRSGVKISQVRVGSPNTTHKGGEQLGRLPLVPSLSNTAGELFPATTPSYNAAASSDTCGIGLAPAQGGRCICAPHPVLHGPCVVVSAAGRRLGGRHGVAAGGGGGLRLRPAGRVQETGG